MEFVKRRKTYGEPLKMTDPDWLWQAYTCLDSGEKQAELIRYKHESEG